jgi:hypothetical protein
MLRALVGPLGTKDWVTVAQFMPDRTPRQCSHRYNNYLTDSHRQMAWSAAEERIILDKFRELGPKWAYISKFLIGRTGNDVKNRWHKHLAKIWATDASHKRAILEPAPEQTSEGSPLPVFRDRAPLAIPTAPPPRNALSSFLQFALNQ